MFSSVRSKLLSSSSSLRTSSSLRIAQQGHDPTVKKCIYAFTVGTAAGASLGVVGWGGAQIIIPSMTAPFPSFAGYSQLSATGISLTSLSFSTVTSGYKFWNENRVDIPLALAIGIPSVLSARLAGLYLVPRLSGDALALCFNAFSIILIPTHLWIQHRREEANKLMENEKELHDNDDKLDRVSKMGATQSHSVHEPDGPIRVFSPDMLPHACFGLFSGVISSLMGVGGLPLSMSYLTEATDLSHHYVQGTAICALLPSILASASTRLHAIPVVAASFVALGAMVGAYGGARLALTLDDDDLRHLYMGSLVIFGSRSTLGAVRNIQRILVK